MWFSVKFKGIWHIIISTISSAIDSIWFIKENWFEKFLISHFPSIDQIWGLCLGCWWAGGGGAPAGDYLFMLTVAGARSEEEEGRGGAHLAAEAETEDLLLNIGHSILCNSPGGRMGEVAATKCWRCHPSQVTRPSAQLSGNNGTR